MNPIDRIEESVIYEAYFDLWGFRCAWIETIISKLDEFTATSLGDHGESFQCEACMAFRFQSGDKSRVQTAKQIFIQYANLANKSCGGEPSEVIYSLK